MLGGEATAARRLGCAHQSQFPLERQARFLSEWTDSIWEPKARAIISFCPRPRYIPSDAIVHGELFAYLECVRDVITLIFELRGRQRIRLDAVRRPSDSRNLPSCAIT